MYFDTYHLGFSAAVLYSSFEEIQFDMTMIWDI